MQPIPGVKSSGGYNYPSAPRQQVNDLLKILKIPSKVLDIGAGFGNNCEPLLEAGHSVTATETNKEALEALRSLAKLYPGQLTGIEESIEALSEKESYDVVVCTMVLHFLTEAAAHRAIDTMQKVTRLNGYHVIVSYLAGQDLSKEYTYLLHHQELPGFYKNWEIVSYEESYPLKFKAIRSLKQFLCYISGHKSFKSARLIAMKKS